MKNPKEGKIKAADQEQQWDNPEDPKNASDQRDIEQLLRQKKEAELRKANLTEDDPTGS